MLAGCGGSQEGVYVRDRAIGQEYLVLTEEGASVHQFKILFGQEQCISYWFSTGRDYQSIDLFTVANDEKTEAWRGPDFLKIDFRQRGDEVTARLKAIEELGGWGNWEKYSRVKRSEIPGACKSSLLPQSSDKP